MLKLKLLLWTLFGVLVTLILWQFQIQNSVRVDVRTLFGDAPQVTLGSVIIWTFLVACIIGFLVGALPGLGSDLRARRLQKKLDAAQSELELLTSDSPQA